MVSLFIKILLVSFLLMFIDLLIAPWLPAGGIPLGRGDEIEYFTLVTLLLRLFEILAAFFVLILHFITHILQPEVAGRDVQLMIDGVLSVIFWVVGSILDLWVHLLNLPFIIIGAILPNVGLSGKWDVLGVIGVYVNLETMTFQINVSPLPYNWDIARYFNLWFNLKGLARLPASGFNTQMKNVISISLLPTRSGYDILGHWITPYVQHKNGMGIVIEMLDFISTEPFLAGYIEIGVNTTSLNKGQILEISMNWILDEAIGMLLIDNPVKWMEKVYDAVLPVGVGSPSTILTEIQNNIKVRKWQLTAMTV